MPDSVSTTTATTLGQFDVFRVTDTEMSREGIISAERFLLGAQMTSHLLLSCVMDCVLVTREIVWSREDGVAWFARRWVDAFALVRPVLCVPQRR